MAHGATLNGRRGIPISRSALAGRPALALGLGQASIEQLSRGGRLKYDT